MVDGRVMKTFPRERHCLARAVANTLPAPFQNSQSKIRNPQSFMSTCDIGLIGLAVMGENLVLNMESRGFHVAVFNRTTSVVEAFEAGRGKGKKFVFAKTLPDFVKAL